MKPRLDLRLSQKLIMTPQLQQAIKLLQLSRMELSQMISLELTENPMLEETAAETDEPAVEADAVGDPPETNEVEETSALDREKIELSSQWEEYISDVQRENRDGDEPLFNEEAPSFEQTLTRPTSLSEHLLWQLGHALTDPQDLEIGRAVIGNIDDDGYLRSPPEEIAASVNADVSNVERVLRLIQSFDPIGVGARDLRECLLIQLEQLGLRNPLAETVVDQHLKDIEARRFEKIARALDVSIEDVIALVKVIQGLEPKPGRPFFSEVTQVILPDIYVIKTDDDYVVVLNDDGLPKLRINPYYRKLLAEKTPASDPIRQYLDERFRSAVWLVRSIEQRNRTISRVAQSILNFQREFFDKGVGFLRPLVLRQVAEDINMHESTISRVTTSKYMHTPQGIFELKYFFNSSITRGDEFGGELSSVSVRELIRKMISEEDAGKPLKDQEIVARLKERHIEIARRTVAKYRTELKIPQAGRRRYIS